MERLKDRIFGAGHRIVTVVGVVAGALVALGQYLDLVPEQYRSSRWYAVAAALVALGAALKLPGQSAPAAGKGASVPPAAIALLAAGALLYAVPAHAGDDLRPATLCAIGSTNAWCFGILPTVTAFGVDVRHGKVVGNFQAGASVAATWHPGRLESLTIGGHWGFGTGADGIPQTFSVGSTVSALKGYLTIITDWQAIGGDHAFVVMPALGLPL